MILTVEELEAFVTTALEEDSLQLLLDAAEADIVRITGAAGATTELFVGGGRLIALGYPADSITSITEETWTTTRNLDPTDYRLLPGGYLIERLVTGPNGRCCWWRGTVVYERSDDDALRRGVQLDLIKLMLSYNPGVTQETVGAWTRQFASNSVWNNDEERTAILSRLYPEPGMIVVGQ